MELAGATASIRPTVSASPKVTFCRDLEGEEGQQSQEDPAAGRERQQCTRPSRMGVHITAWLDGDPCLQAGLHHSPVEDHHHHGTVRAHEG